MMLPREDELADWVTALMRLKREQRYCCYYYQDTFEPIHRFEFLQVRIVVENGEHVTAYKGEKLVVRRKLAYFISTPRPFFLGTASRYAASNEIFHYALFVL